MISCRFLANFLVVSRKKRNFGGKVERFKGDNYEYSCFK